jgi:hypothetical protein
MPGGDIENTHFITMRMVRIAEGVMEETKDGGILP